MRVIRLTLVAALCAAGAALAGEASSPAAVDKSVPLPATVLDLDRGSFRAYLTWKTPVLIDAGGKTFPLPEPKRKDLKEEDRKPFPVRESAHPPGDWISTNFNDNRWPRARGPVVAEQRVMLGDIYAPGNPAEWNRVYLRGRFRVSDPAQVKDLTLVLCYHGGAVIYVNGTELQRGHLPAGELAPDTLAERYGEEAYVRPDGKLYGLGDGIKDSSDFADRIKTRVRALPPRGAPDGVAIPPAMLRKGVNVIAIEVRAAPVSHLAIERAVGGQTWQGPASPWAHAGVLEARLTSASVTGLTPNSEPVPGIEVANSQPLETVATWDYAHPAETPDPICLVGARDGTFSGKVVLSSAGTIRNLKASASELVEGKGKGRIPAVAVLVRWAEPARPGISHNAPERFDRLLAELPAEIPPAKVTLRGNRTWQPVPAAVAPVWITVRVPADAAPGQYTGTITIEAQDPAPVKFTVPVNLKVHDWNLPAPKDFAQRYNLYQSPDTVARYYKVPLWSDKHWALMEESLEVLRQAGNSVCVLYPVVKVPSLNNTESMIRWIRKADGGFDYDFTIIDKYMDLYEKTCGKPAILELFIWEHQAPNDKTPKTPLAVSVLDPATGKIENMPQPPYDTPENEAFWKPVLTELRKRIEKRGWFDVTAVCYTSYSWGPAKKRVDIYKNIWPDGKWMNCSHGNPVNYAASQGSMPVPYSEWVWGCGGLYNPEGRMGGRVYPRPWTKGAGRIEVANPRYGVGLFKGLYDNSPLVLYRAAPEAALQGGVRGLGRVGGDFWPVPTGKDGGFTHLCDSYAAVGPANNTLAMTSPGPDGAIFNERLEMFREGVQITEAIVFLQKALEAGSAGDELARKIEDLLDERARYYLRTRPNQECNWLSFECSDWQERDDRLLALCAEVSARIGRK